MRSSRPSRAEVDASGITEEELTDLLKPPSMRCAWSAERGKPHEYGPLSGFRLQCLPANDAQLAGGGSRLLAEVVAGEVTLYITPFILDEIRRLPDHKNLRRFRSFTHERVERFIEELLDNAILMADPPANVRLPT